METSFVWFAGIIYVAPKSVAEMIISGVDQSLKDFRKAGCRMFPGRRGGNRCTEVGRD
jgi:hypothetical protein